MPTFIRPADNLFMDMPRHAPEEIRNGGFKSAHCVWTTAANGRSGRVDHQKLNVLPNHKLSLDHHPANDHTTRLSISPPALAIVTDPPFGLLGGFQNPKSGRTQAA